MPSGRPRFFCGCLEFGDDIRLVAPDVTDKELNEVTQRNGIRFPLGTTGLAYLYLGSGIDDALAIKVAIPEENKVAFLENEIFKTGSKTKPSLSLQIGRSEPWWKLDDLTERVDRSKQLPKGHYLACAWPRKRQMDLLDHHLNQAQN